MSQHLPTDDAETGYFLEVDLKYPHHLHDLHSDYPLAPETMTVSEDMLPPYSVGLEQSLNITGKPCQKLAPNLRNKDKYILHYRNWYLNIGMVLTKIHRVSMT